jgi:hypothetical protein
MLRRRSALKRRRGTGAATVVPAARAVNRRLSEDQRAYVTAFHLRHTHRCACACPCSADIILTHSRRRVAADVALQTYVDDTDSGRGPCSYRWRLLPAVSAPGVKKLYRLCFDEVSSFQAGGGGAAYGQCGASASQRSTCTAWSVPNGPVVWTSPYLDNTDGRPGGCSYQWRLEVRVRWRGVARCDDGVVRCCGGGIVW